MSSRRSPDIYAETLAVFDRNEDRFEPLTTPEVADALEAERRTVYKRLQTLVDRGELETKKTGSSSRVWWRPSGGNSPREADESDRERPPATDGPRDRVDYRRIFEMIPDGVLLQDPADGRIVDANQQFCRMVGYAWEELLALDFDELIAGVPPYTMDRAEQHIRRAMTEGPQTFEWVDRTKAGDRLPVEVHLRRTTIDGDERILAVVRDITERKERERELRARSAAMEASVDGMAILDPNGEYAFVNQAHADIYGYDDREAFLGETWKMCYEGDELARFEDEIMPTLYEEGGWRGEATGRREDGTTFSQELSLTTTDDGGVICVVRDITDRKEREREVRAARRFNEELVENAPFGMFRLDEELRITYENPRAEEIVGPPDDEDSSIAIGADIRELPSIVETGQADLFSRLKDGETIEYEFPFESVYGKEAYFTGRGVPLYRDGEFDGALLMAVDISERRRHERELERQREQLAALDELNGVVRGITEAVVDRSTRDEIERAVCDGLADSDSYRFAWICGPDASRGVEPRVTAGIDGCLEELLPDPSADGQGGRAPIGRALRSREMQVTRNAVDGPDRGEPADEHGYRSSAAIPIVHQGMCYGVLGVCSERADAFAEAERAVVGQLGEVIGHAIAAVERKRALLSDEVLELEIRDPELLESLAVSATPGGTIAFERTVPLGDEEYLLYGTATADAVAVLRAMGEQLEGWGDVRTITETADEVRFEQHLSNPPLPSAVADHGGYFESGRIEDGEYAATIHLPPGTDVRQVLAEIRETYPNVRSVSQRQVTRETPSPERVLDVLTEKLTERQRAALEAGYYGGFFEWPRDRSGEEVAASLDVGASTFHQHVRKAEKKLLDVLFTET